MAYGHCAILPSRSSITAADTSVRFTRGQRVEVKSASEIAATLDLHGEMDGVPFMPEMFRYCGQSFRVFRRADFVCVEGAGLRRMNGTVFLDDLRCDGSAHDDCRRGCLLFWKEAWLRPHGHAPGRQTEFEVDRRRAEVLSGLQTREPGRYSCQSTALLTATTDLQGGKLSILLEQIRDGELAPGRFAVLVIRLLLNRVRRLIGCAEIGRLSGPRSTSLNRDLRLQAGEWVRVRSQAQIRQTLDPRGRNRGMAFEPEMARYAGRYFQVAFPLTNMIHEETGRMIHPATTVALDGVKCQGLCTKNCPRAHYWFWREDWLDRATRVLDDEGD